MMSSPQLRVLAGASCISFSPVFVGLVDMPATTSGFYRVFFGGAALTLYMLLRGRRFTFPPGAWLLIVFCAVFFTADLWFWHRSINAVGPGLATLLAALQVFFVTLLGAVLLKQRPALRQVLAIPVGLSGLALVIGIDWQALPADYRLGVVFGVLTAVSYSAYLLTLRSVQQRTLSAVPIAELAALSMLTAAMLAAISWLESGSLAIHRPLDALWLLAYGLLPHVVGWLLITSAIARVSPAVFALSLLIQPLLSFIWDMLLFGRELTPLQALGVGLTLLAIVIGGARRAAPKAEAPVVQ